MPIVVRVRWQEGYVELSNGDSSTPRRTIPFDAGNVKTRAKAIEVGQTILQEWSNRPVQSWQLRLGQTPSWPSVGDRIETYGMDGSLVEQRISSRRVAITESGHASLEPTLGTRRDLLVERNQRSLKKLTDGLQGRSSASDPLLVPSNTGYAAGQMSESVVHRWANTGLVVDNSNLTTLSETTSLVRLEMLLGNNSSTNTTQPILVLGEQLAMNVWINGVSPGLFPFPAGTVVHNILLGNTYPAGTTIQYGLVYAGSFALNPDSLLAQLTLTLNLYGVTGTWAQEQQNPELR
jgi:hypothetical protein